MAVIAQGIAARISRGQASSGHAVTVASMRNEVANLVLEVVDERADWLSKNINKL